MSNCLGTSRKEVYPGRKIIYICIYCCCFCRFWCYRRCHYLCLRLILNVLECWPLSSGHFSFWSSPKVFYEVDLVFWCYCLCAGQYNQKTDTINPALLMKRLKLKKNVLCTLTMPILKVGTPISKYIWPAH